MIINNSRLYTPIRQSYTHHVRTLERHSNISEHLCLVELHRKKDYDVSNTLDSSSCLGEEMVPWGGIKCPFISLSQAHNNLLF